MDLLLTDTRAGGTREPDGSPWAHLLLYVGLVNPHMWRQDGSVRVWIAAGPCVSKFLKRTMPLHQFLKRSRPLHQFLKRRVSHPWLTLFSESVKQYRQKNITPFHPL